MESSGMQDRISFPVALGYYTELEERTVLLLVMTGNEAVHEFLRIKFSLHQSTVAKLRWLDSHLPLYSYRSRINIYTLPLCGYKRLILTGTPALETRL